MTEAVLWWRARSQREQILLACLAGLLALCLIWFGVWQPLKRFEQRAAARQERALLEKRAVRTLVMRITALGPVRGQTAARPLAEILRESLDASGLAAARIEPDPDGGMRVAIGGAAPGPLLAWLAGLQTAHAVTARHLVVVKQGQGVLGLDATFIQGGH